MVVANRDSIDIVDLRKPRNLRRGLISPETRVLMERLQQTGQILNITVAGVVVGELGPNTSGTDLAKLLMSYHPNVIQQLTDASDKAKADLEEGRAISGLDVLLATDIEVQIDGIIYNIEDVAREISEFEEKHDVDREDAEAVFTGNGMLTKPSPEYVRFAKLYTAYTEALASRVG